MLQFQPFSICFARFNVQRTTCRAKWFISWSIHLQKNIKIIIYTILHFRFFVLHAILNRSATAHSVDVMCSMKKIKRRKLITNIQSYMFSFLSNSVDKYSISPKVGSIGHMRWQEHCFFYFFLVSIFTVQVHCSIVTCLHVYFISFFSLSSQFLWFWIVDGFSHPSWCDE